MYQASMSLSTRLHSVTSSDRASSSDPDLSDEELVQGLLAGDRRLARVLYDQLRPSIDGTLLRILHRRGPDFEDMVQITFERILRNLAQGRFEGRSSLKTWSSAIAGHVALDGLRRNQRERKRIDDSVEEHELVSSTHSVKRAESSEELQRVQGALSRMKPKLAEALLLHDVLGHKLRELAEICGLSESAAQSRVHRARIDLRRLVARSLSRREK